MQQESHEQGECRAGRKDRHSSVHMHARTAARRKVGTLQRRRHTKEHAGWGPSGAENGEAEQERKREGEAGARWVFLHSGSGSSCQ